MAGLQKRVLCESHLNFILTSLHFIEERNHTNIFEIIEKSGSKFTENDNGVFIRLNQLSLECIWEIYDYIYLIGRRKNNLDDETKSNVKCPTLEKVVTRNHTSNGDLNEESLTAKKSPMYDNTEMFSLNNIEIDSWKKDIIMKLKNKAKK